jgi:hypothetical protein
VRLLLEAKQNTENHLKPGSPKGVVAVKFSAFGKLVYMVFSIRGEKQNASRRNCTRHRPYRGSLLKD